MIAVAAALLLGRFYETYAPAWAIGVAGFVFVMVKGSRFERLLLLLFGLLAVLSPDEEQRELNLRLCVFLSLFISIGRYAVLHPLMHLVLQLCFLLATYVVEGQGHEAFIFGPGILLLLLGSRINGKSARSKILNLFLHLCSVAVLSLGYGSRSALFVWIVAMLRKHVIALSVIGALAVGFSSQLSDVPILEKMEGSVSELLNEEEETGAINLRGIEGRMFIEYVSEAGALDLLVGAREPLRIPGQLIGYEDDIRYVPHNQLFGIFHQFGVAGILGICAYLFTLCRRLRADSDAFFFALTLLPPFFLLKHAFGDTDMALLFASLNWLLSTRKAK